MSGFDGEQLCEKSTHLLVKFLAPFDFFTRVKAGINRMYTSDRIAKSSVVGHTRKVTCLALGPNWFLFFDSYTFLLLDWRNYM